jgi:hypothetical protein
MGLSPIYRYGRGRELVGRKFGKEGQGKKQLIAAVDDTALFGTRYAFSTTTRY